MNAWSDVLSTMIVTAAKFVSKVSAAMAVESPDAKPGRNVMWSLDYVSSRTSAKRTWIVLKVEFAKAQPVLMPVKTMSTVPERENVPRMADASKDSA